MQPPGAKRPTAIPQAAPPVFVEGDLWGDPNAAVGRVTGATVSAAVPRPPIPPPLPLKEGAVPTLRPPVGGNEKVRAEGGSERKTGRRALPPSLEEHIMAFVRVEQRNAHLASAVKLGMVNTKEGPLAKAIVTAISNVRVGVGEDRTEEATSVQWTLWGKQAENAAEYLGKGSHVNIVGRLRNNNYTDTDGKLVYGLAFTVEEIDYLDGRAEADARRAREGRGATEAPASSGSASTPSHAAAAAGDSHDRQARAARRRGPAVSIRATSRSERAGRLAERGPPDHQHQ